jgi:hypothetical protein
VPGTTPIELKDYTETGHFYASLPLCDNGKRERMLACEATPRLHRGGGREFYSISIVAFRALPQFRLHLMELPLK